MRHKNNIPDPLWRVKMYAKRVDEAYKDYCAVYWRLTNTAAPPLGDKILGTAGGKDKYASISIQAERLRNAKRLYDRAYAQSTAIIEQIPNELHRKILKGRYVEGLEPIDVAKANHISADYERHECDEAIEAFRKIWRGQKDNRK